MRELAVRLNSLNPAEILRMATLAAAEALGLDDSVGSLTVGKLANAIAMPLPAGASGDADALFSAALAHTMRPSRVWLGGRPVEFVTSVPEAT
jgi:imidazolonepropionase-like amidohydrolase